MSMPFQIYFKPLTFFEDVSLACFATHSSIDKKIVSWKETTNNESYMAHVKVY